MASLLSLAFTSLPEQDIEYVLSLDLFINWDEVVGKNFARSCSKKEAFLEESSHRKVGEYSKQVFSDETYQLERFRLGYIVEKEEKFIRHSVSFYAENFTLTWRTLPFFSIIGNFLTKSTDEILSDKTLTYFCDRDPWYKSFLSAYEYEHYILSFLSCRQLLESNLDFTTKQKALQIKVIYSRGKKAQKYITKKPALNTCLLATGKGNFYFSEDNLTALAFACDHKRLNFTKEDALHLYLNAYEGWLHHRRTKDFTILARKLIEKIDECDLQVLVRNCSGVPLAVFEKVYDKVCFSPDYVKEISLYNEGYKLNKRFIDLC